MWLSDPAALRELATVLDRAVIDGFAAGPRLASAVRQASSAAATGSSADRLEAERLTSAAWVMYVQALHWPTGGMTFADQSLAPKIPGVDRILADAASSGSLARHVASVSNGNPLYAQLRDAALREGLGSPALTASLGRARQLPTHGRYILVDLASQRLWMMQGGRAVDTMKVIVGKPEMPTPLIAGTISAATVNPYWNVPADLARKNIAPQVLRHGGSYLAAKGYEALSDWSSTATVVDPATVDWQAVADGRATIRLRQKPGPGNMMGRVKFEFPNTQGIYLHDTPDRELFARSQRTFSSGCVRLEDAGRLGRWLVGRELAATGSRPEQQIALAVPTPVFITYLTARVDKGALTFADDIYGLDRMGSARLAAQ